MAAIKSLNPKAEVARSTQALAINISAARGLQDVLRTNLGPKGTMKMYELFSSLCIIKFCYLLSMLKTRHYLNQFKQSKPNATFTTQFLDKMQLIFILF